MVCPYEIKDNFIGVYSFFPAQVIHIYPYSKIKRILHYTHWHGSFIYSFFCFEKGYICLHIWFKMIRNIYHFEEQGHIGLSNVMLKLASCLHSIGMDGVAYSVHSILLILKPMLSFLFLFLKSIIFFLLFVFLFLFIYYFPWGISKSV